MTFAEALERLGISEYGERIFNSNSHGELSHLSFYVQVAANDDTSWFRPIFLECVEHAEKNWQRPESVFQHMGRMMRDVIDSIAKVEK